MVHTHLYVKVYRDEHVNIAHLYEHLLIGRLKAYLNASGVPHEFAGFILGRTYDESIILLETTLYNDNCNKIFADRMSELAAQSVNAWDTNFTDSEIKKSLKVIEIEELSRAEFNLSRLRMQLDRIANLPWKAVNDFEFINYEKSLQEPEEPESLRLLPDTSKVRRMQIDLDFPKTAYGKNGENAALHTRISVLLSHIIVNRLHDKADAVNQDFLQVVNYKSFKRNRFNLYVPADLKEKKTHELIQTCIRDFKDPKNFEYIKDQLVALTSEPYTQVYWGINDFQYADTFIGGAGMKQLLKPDRVNYILDNLEIKVKILKTF
jgi:hypothetical protein